MQPNGAGSTGANYWGLRACGLRQSGVCRSQNEDRTAAPIEAASSSSKMGLELELPFLWYGIVGRHMMSLAIIPLFAQHSLAEGLGLFVVYGLAGILLAVAGYKLFDKLTPGDLHREIFEQKNIAAAILAGSVILGVAMILSAAMSS